MKLQPEQLQRLLTNDHEILQEILGVAFGTKPSLLLSMSKKHATMAKEIFPKLAVVCGGNKLNPVFEQNSIPIYAIAKTNKIAIDLLNAQKDRDHEEIGKLLGYPRCCVENWNRRKYYSWSREAIYQAHICSDNHVFYNNNIFHFQSRLANDASHFKQLREYYKINNKLSSIILHLKFIPHVPCAYDCGPSISIGRENYQLFNEYYPDIAHKVKSVLSKPVLYFDIFKWIVFNGRVANKNVLSYKRIVMPKSLINPGLMGKFLMGDKIIIDDNNIKIFKSETLYYIYRKKDKLDGFLLNFK